MGKVILRHEPQSKDAVNTKKKQRVRSDFLASFCIAPKAPTFMCHFIREIEGEDVEIKRDIFQTLDKLCPAHTIATNTSSLPITAIGAFTKRADKVIGMHFFNPAAVMKLVEIVNGLATSEDTFATVKALAEKLGKSPVRIEEFPGFVGNRIMVPMINEAIYTLMEGVASAEDIDQVAKLGFNHPMGALALSDLIGNDKLVIDILFDLAVYYNGWWYYASKSRGC